MTNKIENRREQNIANAVNSGDWSKIDKLLNQPMDNLERKERYYGKTSLNAIVSNEGQATELMDLYPDNTYNPIEQLLIKERNKHLYNVLSKLPEVDLHIFLEITLYGTSALQLSKETPYKSHKTVKKHYEDTIDILKEELGKYF
ncbi:TPA: sigma-70 family RNA polymerase sigma factor [Streptococcus suis]